LHQRDHLRLSPLLDDGLQYLDAEHLRAPLPFSVGRPLFVVVSMPLRASFSANPVKTRSWNARTVLVAKSAARMGSRTAGCEGSLVLNLGLQGRAELFSLGPLAAKQPSHVDFSSVGAPEARIETEDVRAAAAAYEIVRKANIYLIGCQSPVLLALRHERRRGRRPCTLAGPRTTASSSFVKRARQQRGRAAAEEAGPNIFLGCV
jgi:hypothetical protein